MFIVRASSTALYGLSAITRQDARLSGLVSAVLVTPSATPIAPSATSGARASYPCTLTSAEVTISPSRAQAFFANATVLGRPSPTRGAKVQGSDPSAMKVMSV